jgi:hypothetical protein
MPLFLSICCLVLISGFLYFFYLYPAAGLGPEQPISFSHRIHVGVKDIQCRFCHPNVGRSTFPGMPPVEKCLYCHRYVIPDHPEIRKEHQYFNSRTPIPWVKVTYLPEHVFFNHERHIKKEIECEACHGEVKTMDRLNKVTFRMGFCIECHREKKATLDCWLSCHN